MADGMKAMKSKEEIRDRELVDVKTTLVEDIQQRYFGIDMYRENWTVNSRISASEDAWKTEKNDRVKTTCIKRIQMALSE